jgi:hypothetical protein
VSDSKSFSLPNSFAHVEQDNDDQITKKDIFAGICVGGDPAMYVQSSRAVGFLPLVAGPLVDLLDSFFHIVWLCIHAVARLVAL